MTEPMAGRYVGARVPRVEDPRLLTGEAQFVADLSLPRMLHAAFVRSPHAHALVRGIDTAAALALPGVVAVYTARDLPHTPAVDRMRIAGLKKTPQPALADERVRFVGEAVAVVLAGSRYVAEDAAELVAVEYAVLPAHVEASAAAAATEHLLFPELGSNVIYRERRHAGDAAAAFAQADRVFSIDYKSSRLAAAPMEARGVLADYSAGTGQLTLWSSTQCPHLLRNKLAAAIGLAEHRIRVIAPAVGGGFGQKIPIHPEETAIALAARAVGRPVRWIEDRRENLLAGTHAKEQTIHLELAVKADGTFLGLKAEIVGDAGAYSFNATSALIEPYLAAGLMPGVYHIDHYEYEVAAVLTNKCPVSAYRGVGWTAGHTARELLIDEAARGLVRDPAELRRQNMIRSGEFPYRSCTGMVYDSGSYIESLAKALATLDYPRLRAEQAARRQEGRYLGIGISPYVEPTGWGTEGSAQSSWPFSSHDAGTVSMDPSGKVTLAIGSAPHGQGHETTLAQVVADVLTLPMADITVVHSDTAATPFSIAGTRASRTAVIAGGALGLAAGDLKEKLRRIAGAVLEVAPEDLIVAEGAISLKGAPSRSLTLKQVAEAAYFDPRVRAVEPEPHLNATRFYDPKATYANGCIAVVVEVDAATGMVAVRQAVAVEDCGTVINPAIVDGQVRGAVAQGIGAALLEQMVHDETGQVLTASYMDYLLPTATEIPSIAVEHLCSPSPFTLGGIKGMGESGLISTPAAVANAVADALAPFGARISQLPLTPEAVRNLLP